MTYSNVGAPTHPTIPYAYPNPKTGGSGHLPEALLICCMPVLM